jgi:hypothetical protein
VEFGKEKKMLNKGRITTVAAVAVLAFSVVAVAQVGRWGTGQWQFPFNPAAKTALQGIVDSVGIAPGQRMPSFAMTADGKKVTVIVGPYWAIANANYEIQPGQQMSVLAFPATTLQSTYFAAELQNMSTGKVLTLRNDQGFPVSVQGGGGCGWGRGRGMHGAGFGPSNCPYRFNPAN